MIAAAVGMPVFYVPDDDHADDPRAAAVTKVHPDGCACLVFWCPDRKGWFEARNVPPFDKSDGDTNQPYFAPVGYDVDNPPAP